MCCYIIFFVTGDRSDTSDGKSKVVPKKDPIEEILYLLPTCHDLSLMGI